MAYELKDKMVIGISSRALFDLSVENEIFETQGVEAYCRYQIEHEQDILKPGPGFALVRALLRLNELREDKDFVEVIIMSRNSPDTSLRVFNAIRYYGLHITRAALVSGAALAPYLTAFRTDLFLSAYEDDVQYAIDNNIAAGMIYTETEAGENVTPMSIHQEGYPGQIRIAFDGDAVLFSDEAERVYQSMGLREFERSEWEKAATPLKEGPFASFLQKLSKIQKELGTEDCPIRTALVTARSAPAHERVIRTLRSWDVRVDEAFFLGGVEKKDFLKAFGAQIFFDDQSIHARNAASVVPSAKVPWPTVKQKEEIKDELQTYRTG